MIKKDKKREKPNDNEHRYNETPGVCKTVMRPGWCSTPNF